MKKIITICLLLFVVMQLKSQQLSVGYFPFNNTFSITSNPERLLWLDARIETNTFYGNLNPELLGLINIKRTDFYNVYLGMGCKMNFIDSFNEVNYIGGYTAAFGSRIKPFEKWSNFYFVFELSPYVNKEFSSGILRAFLGISYKFKGRNKPPVINTQ